MGITCGVPNCFEFLGLKCRSQIIFKLNKLYIVKKFLKCRYQSFLWGWGGGMITTQPLEAKAKASTETFIRTLHNLHETISTLHL
jgi:hypothetical protein